MIGNTYIFLEYFIPFIILKNICIEVNLYISDN